MIIIIDPKELEHILMFLSITAMLITIAYIAHKIHQNNK